VDFGLALQNHRPGASPAGLTASADAAVRHGWRSVWAVDHMVVGTSEAADYGTALEALTSLAWLSASHPRLRIATGVVVPAMRDAVQLAKELATLDLLSNGALTVGVGVGDLEDLGEYRNLGKEDRFRVRGAYLDETIALWRHLWGGRTDPFEGRFIRLTDYVFSPLPVQGAGIPILSGGRSDRALARVSRVTDGLYSSRWGPADLRDRWPAILEAAEREGRPRPFLATRVRVRFDRPADATFSVRGSSEEMVAQLVEFAEVGTDEFVAVFDAVLPDDIQAAADRFARQVVEPFREAWTRRTGR
jgi:alkanesulfonate monooxygenase SsuD/methylene tetrahydromethanopterin reductase-like flavin-dependent oxidoreductase (luciferase family)